MNGAIALFNYILRLYFEQFTSTLLTSKKKKNTFPVAPFFLTKLAAKNNYKLIDVSIFFTLKFFIKKNKAQNKKKKTFMRDSFFFLFPPSQLTNEPLTLIVTQ